MEKMLKFFESEKTTLVLIGIISLCLLLILNQLFYQSIVFYSLQSLKGDCDMQNATNQQLADAGYAGYYSISTGQIVTLFNLSSSSTPTVSQEQYNSFIVHEMCHAEQHRQGRMFNCNSRMGVLVNEMECYWKQGNFWYYFQNL
jgi:hypothetical protein